MSLNDFIYEDLRTCIQAGTSSVEHLTLSALSRQYNVSLTPVRIAIDRLVDEKYLEKLENGRVQVCDRLPRHRKSSKPPNPPANPDAALQADVIHRGLRGNSEYIREEAAAAKYGVGRTVIRAALSRLAGKGLLEWVPRCGWRPRTFDKQDLCDFLKIREALELTALEQARPRLDHAVLRQLLDDNQRRRRLTSGALANNLHAYWIGLAQNRYVDDFFDRHGMYYGALFDFATPSAEAIEEMASQHCTILEALLASRWREARRALAGHIRAQKPIVQRVMARLREIPFP